MDAFIDDGYTKHVGIEAVDGLHPEMTFVYRPFAGDEVSQVFRLVQIGPTAIKPPSKKRTTPADLKRRQEKIASEQQPDAISERAIGVLLERIESWGFDRELSVANLKRLNAKLFEHAQNIVFGEASPDFELDENGCRIEPADEVEDAKNLQAGSTS